MCMMSIYVGDWGKKKQPNHHVKNQAQIINMFRLQLFQLQCNIYVYTYKPERKHLDYKQDCDTHKNT